jgi:hypothetical protein
MNRDRAAIVSLAVAVAAVAGVFAAGRSVALGEQARSTADAQVARRSAQLDRYQTSLVETLSRRPPPLPPIPSSGSGSASAVQPVRVVYHRRLAVGGVGSDEERGGENDDD